MQPMPTANPLTAPTSGLGKFPRISKARSRRFGMPLMNSAAEAMVCVFESFRLAPDRKSTRLNSSHSQISYAVFCLKKKKKLKQVVPTKRLTYIINLRYKIRICFGYSISLDIIYVVAFLSCFQLYSSDA